MSDIPILDIPIRAYASGIDEDGTEILCEATLIAGVFTHRFVVLSGDTE